MALIHELLRLGRVDLDYLARLTDAGWLVDRRPGHGRGRPVTLATSRAARSSVDAADRHRAAGRDRARGRGSAAAPTLPDGRRAMPVFALLAERYRDPAYAPEAVAERCGIPAATIQRIAAEIGHVAFERPVFVDAALDRHDAAASMPASIGRPVAMHAMRGISAHANGFQTCRALHLLQLLIGSVDVPGGWRYKAPYPAPLPARTAPVRAGPTRSRPASRCPARRSASRAGPRTCCSMPTARRCGSTRRSAGTRRWPSTACCRR